MSSMKIKGHSAVSLIKRSLKEHSSRSQSRETDETKYWGRVSMEP
jgi:hypothetical protein